MLRKCKNNKKNRRELVVPDKAEFVDKWQIQCNNTDNAERGMLQTR